ncbi:MAG TPA: LPXTG cell wall anchor domain-containing protein [Actinoplanes sp.]|nr:LPXTG cell wall anchor domain-containing protein [Actinoplanes sp.]
MSFSRRLAAGITTVGASVLIVLAPSGAFAATAADATAVVVADVAAAPAADVAAAPALIDQVAVLTPVTTESPATTAPATEPQRGGAGYGATTQEVPGGEVSPATGTAPATTPAAPPTATVTPTRGGPGYTTPPTTTPPTTTPPSSQPPASPSVTPGTPGGIAGSKTPTGVKSASAKVKKPKAPQPAGLKDASLPVTGPTLNGSLALGGLLVAAGAMTVWFTRRRRDA